MGIYSTGPRRIAITRTKDGGYNTDVAAQNDNLNIENMELRIRLINLQEKMAQLTDKINTFEARGCGTCRHRQAFTKGQYLCRLHRFTPTETFGGMCGKWAEQ